MDQKQLGAGPDSAAGSSPESTPARRVSRRTLLGGAAAAIGVATIGGGAVALASWNARHNTLSAPADPLVDRAAPAPGTTAAAPRPPTATRKWTVDSVLGSRPASGRLSNPPLWEVTALVAAEGTVYVGGGGITVALDGARRARGWRYTAPLAVDRPDRFHVALAAADGAVYVASRGAAIGLDAATGMERWRVNFSDLTDVRSDVYTSAVTTGSGVAYFAHGSLLAALDLADGSPRWLHHVDGEDATSLTVAGDQVLVSNGSGVDALDVATGRISWQHASDNTDTTLLSSGDGAVFLSTHFGAVVALDAATGAPRWEADVLGGGALNAERPVFVDGAVVVLGVDGKLHALEAATGRRRWSGPDHTVDPVAVDIAPVADPAGGLVYTCGRERVYAFDTTSGSLRWMLDTADGSSWGPVLLAAAAGVVYGASQFSTTSAITL